MQKHINYNLFIYIHMKSFKGGYSDVRILEIECA